MSLQLVLNSLVTALREMGTAASGNWGHEGRKGKVGGSGSGEGGGEKGPYTSTFSGGYNEMSASEQDRVLGEELKNFKPLLDKIVNQTSLYGQDKEDFEEQLRIRVWETLRDYKPERGKFANYLKLTLSGSKLDAINKSVRLHTKAKELERIVKNVTSKLYPSSRTTGPMSSEED